MSHGECYLLNRGSEIACLAGVLPNNDPGSKLLRRGEQINDSGHKIRRKTDVYQPLSYFVVGVPSRHLGDVFGGGTAAFEGAPG